MTLWARQMYLFSKNGEEHITEFSTFDSLEKLSFYKKDRPKLFFAMKALLNIREPCLLKFKKTNKQLSDSRMVEKNKNRYSSYVKLGKWTQIKLLRILFFPLGPNL